MEEGEGEEREEKGMIWMAGWMRKEWVVRSSSQCRRRDSGHWEGVKQASDGIQPGIRCPPAMGSSTNCDPIFQSTLGIERSVFQELRVHWIKPNNLKNEGYDLGKHTIDFSTLSIHPRIVPNIPRT